MTEHFSFGMCQHDSRCAYFPMRKVLSAIVRTYFVHRMFTSVIRRAYCRAAQQVHGSTKESLDLCIRDSPLAVGIEDGIGVIGERPL